MRLINTSNLQLEEFFDERIPQYVILSHTWGRAEISMQEFQNGLTNDKIKNCCKRAQIEGFQYAWVDTCCINKTSSAELSEAINSMYRWYQRSAVCYVLLEDFSELRPETEWWERTEIDAESLETQLRSCRWFTRGWTLQELIAPSCVEFYDVRWAHIGSRIRLRDVVSAITGIPLPILNTTKSPHEYNVAVRMSWAAKRHTTRLEDEAYCLLGLFDINMPMLYGEGNRAFQRLQEEILNRYEDYSLFAWVGLSSFRFNTQSPFLASAPSHFDESRLKEVRFEDLIKLENGIFGNNEKGSIQTGPSFTPRGLSVTLPLIDQRMAICSVAGDPPRLLCLKVIQTDTDLHTYVRDLDDTVVLLQSSHFNEGEVDSDDIPDGPELVNLSDFVFTSMNLALTSVVPPGTYGYGSCGIDITLPLEMESRLRSFSVEILKFLHRGLVKNLHPHSDYSLQRSYSGDPCLLLFRHAISVSGASHAGLAFGIRKGAPWCNIIRKIALVDFFSIPQNENDTRFHETVFGNWDRAGTPGGTSDFCRMRIGREGHRAYMVARVRKVGSGSDSQIPRLVLEIAVTPFDPDRVFEEAGVLNCQFQFYRGSSLVKEIGRGDVVLESGDELSRWNTGELDVAEVGRRRAATSRKEAARQ